MATDVGCPHCERFLFKFVVIENKGFRTEQIPPLQEENGKYFITCPHLECRKRIELDWRGEGLSISPVQKG